MTTDRFTSTDKIASALAMMAEALKHQEPIKCPSVPSWMQPIARYGRETDCGQHECCASFREAHWKTISSTHPDCIVREFRDNGVKYFVVYAEFSQLSRKLGRGANECLAWANALKDLSPVGHPVQHAAARPGPHVEQVQHAGS